MKERRPDGYQKKPKPLGNKCRADYHAAPEVVEKRRHGTVMQCFDCGEIYTLPRTGFRQGMMTKPNPRKDILVGRRLNGRP